jgi:hypothetical protein
MANFTDDKMIILFFPFRIAASHHSGVIELCVVFQGRSQQQQRLFQFHTKGHFVGDIVAVVASEAIFQKLFPGSPELLRNIFVFVLRDCGVF